MLLCFAVALMRLKTHAPHPRFLVQGHILNIGGDALIVATSNCWQNLMRSWESCSRERVSYLEKEDKTLVRNKQAPKTQNLESHNPPPPLFLPYKIFFFKFNWISNDKKTIQNSISPTHFRSKNFQIIFIQSYSLMAFQQCWVHVSNSPILLFLLSMNI
jgi:hypothetical protein